MKICPVGAQYFQVDGQIDGHDEANSGFSQFRKYAQKRCTWFL